MKRPLYAILLAAIVGLTATSAPTGRYLPESMKAAERAGRVHKLETGTEPVREMRMTPVRTSRTNIQSMFAVKSDSYRVPQRKAMASRATSNLPKMQGNVVFSDHWSPTDEYTKGFYTVPTDDSMNFDLILDGPDGNRGGVVMDGVFYYHFFEDFMGLFKFYNIYGYNLETGDKVFEVAAPNVGYMTQGLAQDPTTGKVYGIFYTEDGTGMRLATIEYTNSEGADDVVITTIGSLAGRWNALACDSQGQLYGIYVNVDDATQEILGSSLYRLDKTSAATTLVGETGQLPFFFTGAAIEHKTNRMFWAVSPADNTGKLCEVNLTTGEATVVYDFPGNEEVAVLHIPAPEAEDKAPAVVSGLAADFERGSLSGMVSFTAPTTLFDGTAASGELSYTVRLNGTVAATGTTTFGAQTNVAVTAPSAGEYEISVRTSNATGESPIVKMSTFIGKGVPTAPAPRLSYDNGSMTLEWNAVTTSADGGYVDAAAVTYTVTRYPDGTVVAENLSSNSFTEAYPMPDNLISVYYTVAASYDGKTSEAATSNTVVLGNVQLPYSQTFDDASALEGYTLIDGNNDGLRWEVLEGTAFLRFNMTLALDDWMITPPALLKKGMTYQISFDANAWDASYSEFLEVKVGKGTTPAELTTVVLPRTELVGTTPVRYTYAFSPEEDGRYNLGFHGISPADTYGLCVDNINIEEGFATDGPAQATNLKAVADPDGLAIVKVSFTTPTTTYSGKALDAITEVKLLCGDKELKSFASPAPGEALSYTDTTEGEGLRTYTVICYGVAGQGVPASVSTFVGIDVPGTTAEVSFVETATDGEVMVNWDAISVDRNGNAINPSKVKYNLYAVESGQLVPVAQDLTATNYTYRAVAEGTQKFMQFAVTGVTSAGEGQPNGSGMRAVGTPYTDIRESFANKQLGNNIWGLVRLIGTPNYYLLDETFGIEAVDCDHGYFGLQASGGTPGESGAIFSGKITMPADGMMGVSFYVYCNGEDDANEVEVRVAEGNSEFKSIGKAAANSKDVKEGWNKFFFDLGEYAGKNISVQIVGTIKVYSSIMFDNIRIGKLFNHDLAALSLNAPAKVKPGESCFVSVKVLNDGLAATETCVVTLLDNGESAAIVELGKLAVGELRDVSFVWHVHPLEKDDVSVSAVVDYAADEAKENNSSAESMVAVRISNLPAVTDLVGESVSDGVKLTWSKPEVGDIKPELVDESFEDATAFAHEYEGWTFVDVDQKPVGGSYMFEVPGIITNSTCASFFVFDGSDPVYGFTGHTGNKFLASFFCYDGSQVDDWAISPELSGNAQTISFFARSYMSFAPETIEVYYSTGGTNPSDFVIVKNAAVVPEGWTQYTATLPEGAKYFAIRTCAVNGYFLFVDDFTFEAAPTVKDLKLLGYDVYEGSSKVNSEPVADENYEYVPSAEVGSVLEFSVITLYDKGMSASSNVVTVTLGVTGVAEVGDGISITREGNTVAIRGAEGLAIGIYDVDGKVVFSGTGAEETIVELSAGVYIVRAGSKVVKLIIS